MRVILIQGERHWLLKGEEYPAGWLWLWRKDRCVHAGTNASFAWSPCKPGPAVSSWKVQGKCQWVTYLGQLPMMAYWEPTIMCHLNSKLKLPSEREKPFQSCPHPALVRLPAWALATAVFSASFNICSSAFPSEDLESLMQKSLALFFFFIAGETILFDDLFQLALQLDYPFWVVFFYI